mgnify:FL=1
MHKFSFLIYILLLLALQAKAVVLPPYSDFNHMQSPKHEVRAVWLTTIGGLDWPHSYAQSKNSIAKQQAELCTLLDQYAKAGINTVLIQTRIRGTVIYPSAYEPWDGCLSGFPGTSPGYDALKFAIDECHKRGMELHAWVVTLPMGKWNKLGCRKLHAKYPGLIKKIGPDGYMDPENPRTATYLADICEEITRNYDVDGIHLDYIRYPETWKMRVSASRGRQNITSIVRNIHDKVKRLKPWVKMSCSPIGKFDDLSRYWSHGWNAYTKVCQDAQGWLRDGLMDELFPMMYFRNDQFFPFAIDWAEQSHGKIVAPGLGIYFLDPKEGKWNVADVTREMEVLRQYGLGHAFFRGRFFTDNIQGIYDFAKRFNASLALVPPMTWQSASAPNAPNAIEVCNDGLAWEGDAPYYNVYSSRTWPVDTHAAENLIAIRRAAHSLKVNTHDRFFAVTAMDRYGNESRPLQSHEERAQPTVATQMLACDGTWLQLPAKPSTLDADMVACETVEGTVVCTGPYAHRLNVARLAEGTYILRSLNRKGVSHRLGHFQVRRRL